MADEWTKLADKQAKERHSQRMREHTVQEIRAAYAAANAEPVMFGGVLISPELAAYCRRLAAGKSGVT